MLCALCSPGTLGPAFATWSTLSPLCPPSLGPKVILPGEGFLGHSPPHEKVFWKLTCSKTDYSEDSLTSFNTLRARSLATVRT